MHDTFKAPLDAAQRANQVHMFVEEDGAPSDALADAIVRVALDCKATAVVMHKSIKSPVQRVMSGSVTSAVTKRLQIPIILVP